MCGVFSPLTPCRRRSMNALFFLVLLLSSSFKDEGFLVKADDDTRVSDFQVGEGVAIRKQEFPWFSAILKEGAFRCSGAFIGSRYVLTARHCMEGEGLDTTKDLLVEVGYLCLRRDNCGRPRHASEISHWIPHSGGGDFAIVVLKDEVPKEKEIQPVLPYLGPEIQPKQRVPTTEGDKMTLVGGGFDDSGDILDKVEKLRVQFIPLEQCREEVENPDRLLDEFDICSGSINGTPCKGDSGAALIIPGRGPFRGRDVIVAVHKFGPTQCRDPNSRIFGHFLLSEASRLILNVACGDGEKLDWCEEGQNQAGPEDEDPPNGSGSPKAPSCPDGEAFDASTNSCVSFCRQENGLEYNSTSRRCQDICSEDKVYIPEQDKCENKCKLKNGLRFDFDLLSCVSICPESQVFDTDEKECVCPGRNERYRKKTETCECDEGFTLLSGVCTENEKVPSTCRDGQRFDANKRKCVSLCRKEDGLEFNPARGRCQDICSEDKVYKPKKKKCDKKCKSRKGLQFDFDLLGCVSICSDAQVFDAGVKECVCPGPNERYDKKKDICKCEKGYTLVSGVCTDVSFCREEDGLEFDLSTGRCQDICPEDRFYQFSDKRCEKKCKLRDGLEYDFGTLGCVSICPNDLLYELETQACVCPGTNEFQNKATGECECQEGFARISGGCTQLFVASMNS